MRQLLGHRVVFAEARLLAAQMANLGAVLGLVLLLSPAAPHAQTGATLSGRVFDTSGAIVVAATVTVIDPVSGFVQTVTTDSTGRYSVTTIPVGRYEVTAVANGFRTERIADFSFEVGRTFIHDFHLAVGHRSETIEVSAAAPLIDRASMTVGHVVAAPTIQALPLNGQHLTDLGVLGPGSVAPSQTGFSTTPIRGTGALAINTAGNREEAVGFVVNGVLSNNLTFGSLMFEPPIASVQEFKIDNSTLGAEYGHVSGAVINIVTRSGTDLLRGETYGFLRNDALDARNFFERTDSPHPFTRTQFGGSVGGPLMRQRSFFFVTYEGMRQRQRLDMNSLVFTDDQRASASDPVVRRLLESIPRANVIEPDGTARFVGSALAVADQDRWTIDMRHSLTTNGRLHGFYGRQQIQAIEPSSQGTTIPGFGHESEPLRSLLTIDHTQASGSNVVNEVRFGRSGLNGSSRPRTTITASDVGIRTGFNPALVMPQINVAGGLTFGGPANFPAGRNDASYVIADTLSYARGRHTVRLGGEYLHFKNENIAEGSGLLNFPSVDAFLAGTANAFSITLRERRNHIEQRAVSAFVQDRLAIGSALTVDLGLRFDWHITPTERDDQFVVFDADAVSLQRVGVDLAAIYQQNRNLQPRLGLAWDVSRDGRTVLRAAYGITVDEPGTRAVRDTAANPPFAMPLAASGAIPIAAPLLAARPAGLAPATVDRRFENATLHSWNVNVQRQVTQGMAVMAGYFGSRGIHLQIWRNINQPIEGVQPFGALSSDSPIAPGTPLGNIIQVGSSGYSSYRGLWLSMTKRLSRGLQFDASYTWSRSLDTNSLNSSNFAVQNSYDIASQYGPSDFDARHRFILNFVYDLPFTGHALTRGWQLAAIAQSQSGNPINIVTSTSTLNGTPNTVRPDVTGPIRVIGSVDRWFDASVFTDVNRFGNLGRNAVVGPAYHNTDVSVIKNQKWQNVGVQLRADIFDVFNHPNFGPPGNIVGSPTFGKITRTRLSTGEGGSSRQIQLAIKLSF